MSAEGSPKDLGKGILYFEADDRGLPGTLSGRKRFMDVLWLPCGLNELSEEQICVINRFREERINTDLQFRYANRSRNALLFLISTFQIKSLLEIGCGKFPLIAEMGPSDYRGIEIDPNATAHCKASGYDVRKLSDFPSDNARFALAASLYAMHFSIEPLLVRYLAEHLTENGCLVFNVIVDDSAAMLSKMALLTCEFSSVRIVKEDALSQREFFFVIARQAGDARARELAERLRVQLRKT